MGARPELREEMMTETGVPFIIMTTETFLRHVKAYLDFDVAPETIDQAKELPGVLDDNKRMLAMRRERAQIALMEIRLRRTDVAQEAAVAAARERALRSAIARGEKDSISAELLRGELDARLTDRMAAETRLTGLIDEESHARVELAEIEKDLDSLGHSDA